MVSRTRLTHSLIVIVLTICIYTATAQDEEPHNPADHPPESQGEKIHPPETRDELEAPGKDAVGDSEPVVGASVDGEGELVVEQPITLISCYQCNTAYHGEVCASSDPVQLLRFLKPCPALPGQAPYQRCRKMFQSVEEKERTIRSCALLGTASPTEEECNDRVGSYKISITTCECFNKDPSKPCNTATHITVTSSIVATSLVLAVMRVFM